MGKNRVIELYQRGGRRQGQGWLPPQNLYGDGVITPTGFIPTYAGQPLEQFNQTADLLKEEYDQNVAQYDAVQAWIAAQNATPGDQQAQQEAFDPYTSQLADIAGTGRYERMGPQIRALAAQASQDPHLKAIGAHYTRAQELQAIDDQLRATGAQTLYDSDPFAHETVTTGPDGEKIINPYTHTTVKKLDWTAPKVELANMINPDTLNLSPKEFAQNVAGYITMGAKEGIDDTKVRERMDGAVDLFIGTDPGTQEFEYLMSTNGEDEDAARGQILKELVDAGELRVYSKEVAREVQNWKQKSDYEYARDNPIEGPGGDFHTEATVNSANRMNEDFDDDGLLKVKTTVLDADGEMISKEEAEKLIRTNNIPLKDGGNPLDVLKDYYIETYDNIVNNLMGADTNPANISFVKGNMLEDLGYQIGTNKTFTTIESDNQLAGMYNWMIEAANTEPTSEEAKFYAEMFKGLKGKTELSTEDKNNWRAEAGRIYNSIGKNNKMKSLDWEMLGDEKLIDAKKATKLYDGVIEGQEVALIGPRVENGGTYKDLNGFDGIKENIAALLEKNIGEIKFEVTEMGVSKGNPYGIPGAVVSQIEVTEKGNSIGKYTILTRPSDQKHNFPNLLINDMYMDNASGTPGLQEAHTKGGLTWAVENLPRVDEKGDWTVASRVYLDQAFINQLKSLGVYDQIRKKELEDKNFPVMVGMEDLANLMFKYK